MAKQKRVRSRSGYSKNPQRLRQSRKRDVGVTGRLAYQKVILDSDWTKLLSGPGIVCQRRVIRNYGPADIEIEIYYGPGTGSFTIPVPAGSSVIVSCRMKRIRAKGPAGQSVGISATDDTAVFLGKGIVFLRRPAPDCRRFSVLNSGSKKCVIRVSREGEPFEDLELAPGELKEISCRIQTIEVTDGESVMLQQL